VTAGGLYIGSGADPNSYPLTAFLPMHSSSFRSSSFVLALASVWLCTARAGAITITFDADQHYSTTGGEGGTGNLKGQPSLGSSWSGGVSGSAAAIVITENEGATGTDQAACTLPGNRTTPESDYVFVPSESDLGGTFNPTSSVLYYSFQLKPSAVATSFGTTILRMRLCGRDDKKAAINMGLGNNGVFNFTTSDGGGTSVLAKPAPGGAKYFAAAVDTYFTVCGAINYATKTYTISVNGVPQAMNGNTNFHFSSLSAGPPRLDLKNYGADDSLWVSTSIDNISLSFSPDGIPKPPAGTRLRRSKPAPTANLDPGVKVGENLIVNPSFENPPASYGWNQNNWPKNDVQFVLDQANPHSGKQSQRISIRHITGSAAVLQFMQPPLPVRPGMSLQLRCWTRGPANTRPIAVLLRKRGSPYTTYFRAEISLTAGWTESVFTITMPANTDMHDTVLDFELLEENTFWLDDVSLVLLPAQEAGVPLVGNQLKNGSFEVGRDKWYATFRESGFKNMDLAEENNVTANIVVRPEEGAPHGRNVLAWEILNGSGFELTSAYFHLRYGHPASIRFWLKCPHVHSGFSVSLGQGKFPNLVSESQTFKSSREGWNFYQIVVTPKPADGGTYYLDFKMSGPGKYELDGVSVVEGETADQAFPPVHTEAGWGLPEGTPPGNLFYPADKIRFPLYVTTATGEKEIPVHLRLLDYRDRELKQSDTVVNLDAEGRGHTSMLLPADRLGGFKVEARLGKNASAAVPNADLLYSVVPRLKPPAEAGDSFFGGHVNLTPYNLAIAERLGFRWLRLHPPLCTKWMVVEGTKGTFQFGTQGVARARERGFHVQGTFDTTPWFYADGDPAQTRGSAWYSSYPPADWPAWRNYVQKTAVAFGPYVQAWEIWNEPDGGFLRVKPGEEKEKVYVNLVRQTRKALDDAGIHAFLIGNVAATLDRPFTWRELEMGGGKEVDALSFHLYNEDRGPEEKQPALADQLAKLRSYPNRSGKAPDLWNTENGIWLSSGRSWLASAEIPAGVSTTMADAANTVTRALAGLKAMGVKRYFQYAAFAAPSGRIVHRDECCGIIDVNGVPHPAGAAYAAAVYFLEDAQPAGLEVLAAGSAHVTMAKFHAAAGPITVIWSRDAVKLGQIPGLDWLRASGFDLMGNPISLSPDTPVTLDPIYLVQKGN
jgi:hypothetical protein